jgi:hypothetical protein
MIERARHLSPALLAWSAASMLAIAVVGGAIIDWLWLALIPAAVLLFLAVGAIHARWAGRDGRLGAVGSAALRLGCLGLLAAALVGLVVAAMRGVEPGWLAMAAIVSGVTFVSGEVIFGIGAAWRRAAPRGAAILFAIAIPLGLAVDFIPQLVAPIPLFFAGAGMYIGLGLLALSVARLGRAVREVRMVRQEPHRRLSTSAPAL